MEVHCIPYHAATHLHTHTHTHTYIHTYMRAYTHAIVCKFITHLKCTCMHKPEHSRPMIQQKQHALVHSYITYTYTHARIHPYTHTYTHAHTHTCTHIHTHIHTYTHAHTRTHQQHGRVECVADAVGRGGEWLLHRLRALSGRRGEDHRAERRRLEHAGVDG